MVIVDSRTPEEYHRGCIPGLGEHARRRAGAAHRRAGEAARTRPSSSIAAGARAPTSARSRCGAWGCRIPSSPSRTAPWGGSSPGSSWSVGPSAGRPRHTAKGRAAAAEVAKRVAQADGLRGINAARAQGDAGRAGTQENLYVFDVRTTEEYAAGHVRGRGVGARRPGGAGHRRLSGGARRPDRLRVRRRQPRRADHRVVQAARLPAISPTSRAGSPPGRRRAARSSPGIPRPRRGGSRRRARRPRRSRRVISATAVVISVDPERRVSRRRTCRARPGSAGAGSSGRSAPLAPDKGQALVVTLRRRHAVDLRRRDARRASATRRRASSRAACARGRRPGAPSRPGPRGSPTRPTTWC